MRRDSLRAMATVLAALSLAGVGCQRRAGQRVHGGSEGTAAAAQKHFGATPSGKLQAIGPFQHDNLALYLVTGSDRFAGESFLTLDEALERKLLVVHETQNVNELALDNLSEDQEIFIHRGEIVSGGKQDRVLGVDLIVRAKARGVRIPSFCVESGRWSGRTGLAAMAFLVTNFNYVRRVAPTAEAEIGNVPSAVHRFRRQQSAVWANVKGRQRALAGNVPGLKLPSLSPSSLDLTLEEPKLKAAVKAYTDKLASIIEGRRNVLGVAVVINGKIDSADVYGSSALFRKFWPKLLKAAAVDAVAARRQGQLFRPPPAKDVAAWLEAPREGSAVKRTATERMGEHFRAVHVETADDVLLDTVDERTAASIHRTYLKKLKPQP